MNKKAAVFDLDYTITRNDTFLTFIKHVLRRHPSRWLRALPLPFWYFLKVSTDQSGHWLKEKFLTAICKGIDASNLNDIVEALTKHILEHDVRAGALTALRDHQSQGDEVIIATASFDFYVSPLAAAMGVKSVVATRAEFDGDQKLTGKIAGKNCKGDEKLRRVQESLAGQVFSERCVYTDHPSDLPLLEWADRRFLVHPSKSLAAHGDRLQAVTLTW